MDEFLAFVTIDVWTMIFTWGNLIILFLLMKKFLFKPANRLLEQRQKQAEDMLKNAENDMNEAEKLKNEYQEKLDKAEAYANEMVKEASRKATLKEEEIIKEANSKAAGIIERANKQIELEKESAFQNLKEEVSSISCMLASKILEKDISEEDHREIIGKFINEIGESK